MSDSLQYSIVIVKQEFKLYLLYGADTEKVYDIAIGKVAGDKQKVGDCRTPEGEFYLVKIEDSSRWEHDFKGDGKGPVKGAYGPWFLRLYTGAELTKSGKTWRGIAIHGTHDPSSIGTMASEGCIRMRNEDISELKKFAYPQMPVTILP